MGPAKAAFRQYLKDKGLRTSKQREQILDVFLKTEGHLTTDNLYDLVRKRNPRIGLATVYRTMKTICGAGLAREVDFGDGVARFEHSYGHERHHHLICLRCGRSIEVMTPEIEDLQKVLAKKHRFTTVRYSMRIFGICRACKNRGGKGSKSAWRI